jgi:hypothetical protein
MADTPSIYHALAAVKKEIGAVGKDQRNTMQNFNFRGVDAVVNAAAPLLNDHGVITVPFVLDAPVYETVEVGSKRTPMAHVILRVAYNFFGPAGDCIQAVVVSESMDSGDKAMPKAMSVAYRIALLQVLNLPTTDRDPDEESFERSAREATPAARAPRGGTAPSPQSAQELAKEAGEAKSVDSLRGLYRHAGSKGWLKEHVRVGAAEVVLEDYIQERNDEIARPKSPGAAGNSTRGGGR